MDYNTSTPYRVLMTADTIGGVWNYCMELCSALLQEATFYLVTTGAPLQPEQRKQVDALPNVVLYETAYKLEWMPDPWNDIDVSGDWLLALEKRLQPHLIHLNSYAYAALPFIAPKIVIAHSDVFSWWWAVKGELPPAEWNTYYRRVKQGLEAADTIVGISKASLHIMFRLFDVHHKSKIIYNGRNPSAFYTAPKQQVVMGMGRVWDESKNIKLLIEAAPQIRAQVWIAGENQFSQSQLPVALEPVKYLGRLDGAEVVAALSATKVFVLPAHYEPFGFAALEAALCGCALVLGNIPTLREIWQDAALYVDGDDAGSLANTVNTLLADDAVQQTLAAKAKQRALQFTSDRMAANYLALYQEHAAKTKLIHQEIA